MQPIAQVPTTSLRPRIRAPGRSHVATAMRDAGRCGRRILLIDVELALSAMVEEWLQPHGWSVFDAGRAAPAPRVDLVIVDVPFPRQAGTQLQRLGAQHAGTPLLVLSSTFFASVDRNGAVARQLGVAGVLPKPLQRDALLGAVNQLVRPAVHAS